MPRQSSGDPRYGARSAERQAAMVVDGRDLGPPLKPQDLLVWLRRLHVLDDREVTEAMRLGAASDLAAIYPELTDAELGDAVEAGEAVTPSRVVAWRKRHREMTWLELRVLLAGLRTLLDREGGRG